MRNITQFLLMLTLSFYIAFAPAVAYADPVTDKIDKLQIDLQKRVGDQWTLSPRNKSVGAGVEIGVSQSYPVTATTTATTAAGATTTNTATLTAERTGSKIFTPTTANVAKRFGMGVAQGLVAMALYDMLKKSVDYVMDPANNQVKYKDFPDGSGPYFLSDTRVQYPTLEALCAAIYAHTGLKSTDYQCKQSGNYIRLYNAYGSLGVYGTYNASLDNYKTVSFDTLAEKSIDMANQGNATAQSGMQTVVGDMITNNEIDNSYFDDADISNDTYNDVVNNYLTTNYPNNTYNYTYDTNNNITSVTINNPKTDTDTDTPTASTPTPTASTPASTTTPTDSKPFELPAFCDWASKVCDFVDWVKQEPPQDEAPKNVPVGQLSDVELENFDRYQKRIYFAPHCPTTTFSLTVLGVTIVKPVDFTGFCAALEQVTPFLVASTYIACAVFVIREI